VSQVILGGYKPSSAVEFTAEAQGFMGPFLEFLARTGAPLMASVYPYFTYATNPSTMDLSYALFTARAPSYGTHVEAPARRWRGGTEQVVFFNVIRERNGRPSGYAWVGRVDVVRKNFVFGRNALQIVILWVYHPIHFLNYMTGGSSVRGKVSLNWVRKFFQIIRSL
jgi:hypothetical protein